MVITVADCQKDAKKEIKLLIQGQGVKLVIILDCWIYSSISERWTPWINLTCKQ
jgi:hypothetical protein